MLNTKTIEIFGDTYTTTENSDIIDVSQALVASVALQWTNGTPGSASDFVAGTSEVDTLTFPALAAATHGDYVSVTDTNGDKWAVALSKAGIAEVTSITAIAEGSVAEKTQLVCTAEGSVKNVTQVVAVADVSASLAGTYFKVYDAGGSVGIWFSISGVPGSAPTGAGACTRAVEVAIAAGDSASTVAGKVTTAFGADAALVVGNVGATLTITDVAYGARTAASDGAVGDATGFAITTTAAGHASNLHQKYFILKDEAGTVGFWFDVDNAGASAPVHGADRAVEITTITSEMTAAQVGTAVYNAIHADSKFNGVSDDTAGTIVVVSTTYGDKTGQTAGDSGFTVTQHTAGAASALTGKYFKLADASGVVTFWIDVGNEGTSQPTVAGTNRYVEITTVERGMTNAQVAGVVRTAIDNDSKFDVGTLSTATFTATCKDLKAVTDSAAGDSGFTVTKVTDGADLGAAPTGAIWASIPAAKKVQVDVSACTDAPSVATAVQTGLAALTGIGDLMTVGAASGADIPVTHTVRMNVTNPVPKNADDSGAGSITVAQTTAGVTSTIDVDANTITIAAHGLETGLKGQLTVTGGGSLPTGLSTGTDYFVIAVAAGIISLASSLANAQAGTAINITSQGTGANTFHFTPTAVAGGVIHAEGSNDGSTWYDVNTTNVSSGSSVAATSNVTATGSAFWPLAVSYRKLRISFTCTAGQVTLTGQVVVKEE